MRTREIGTKQVTFLNVRDNARLDRRLQLRYWTSGHESSALGATRTGSCSLDAESQWSRPPPVPG